MKEIWKDIKGYENKYQISNCGRVKSLERSVFNGKCMVNKKEIILKNRKSKNYSTIALFNIVRKDCIIHRLVAQAFIPNPLNKPEVNHINGIKTDNRVENLEWCTPSENIIHSFKMNLSKPLLGSKNNQAKLNENDILQIRKLKEESKISNRELAKLYNISHPTVNKIINKENWKHI